MKTERLKTYSINIRRKDELQYGQWITAPTEEDAINLFVSEYLSIKFIREEEEEELDILRRENTELRAEIATLRAYARSISK